MTREKIATTLFKTTGIGLLSGFIGGVLLYFAILQNARAHAQEVADISYGSYMCAAGTAAFVFAMLSIPAGAIFGLCLGGFFLWLKSVAERRPLP
jgi:hypothetical protein